VQQFGRIDDPSGANFYAYPSLAVNRYSDVMVGYTKFGPGQYPGAAYSMRLASDGPNTMEAGVVYKAGEASYFKDFGTGDNRWGDFSATVVDPVDDTAMWTLQEYAGQNNMWGTWWAQITPGGSSATPTPGPTSTPTPTSSPTSTPAATPTPASTPTPSPLTINAGAVLPVGHIGAFYDASLGIHGGRAPYVVQAVAGYIPLGLAIDRASDSIAGVPGKVITRYPKIRVTDALGDVAQKTFQITIEPYSATYCARTLLCRNVVGNPGNQ
jgi:hypothetical protein